MKRFLPSALACLLAGAANLPAAENAVSRAAASGTGVETPVVGFVAQSAALRPIVGIPGATLLDDPVALPDGVLRLVVAPGQAYALMEAGAPATLQVLSIAGKLHALPVPDAAVGADRIVFSPNGSAAALYFASSQTIQVLTGLPDAPQMARVADASALNGAAVVSLAVSDGGDALLAGTSGAVTLLASDGSARALAAPANPVSIRFVPGRHDALVADSDGNAVLLLGDVAGSPSSVVLAAAAQGVSAPADVLAADGKTAWVANGGGSNILGIELASGNVTALDCGCNAAALQSLNSPGRVLLRASGSVATWILDLSGPAPRLVNGPLMPQE